MSNNRASVAVVGFIETRARRLGSCLISHAQSNIYIPICMCTCTCVCVSLCVRLLDGMILSVFCWRVPRTLSEFFKTPSLVSGLPVPGSSAPLQSFFHLSIIGFMHHQFVQRSFVIRDTKSKIKRDPEKCALVIVTL